MDIAAKIEFLRGAIATQRTTLYLQTTLTVLLVSLGITVVILGFVKPGLVFSESLKAGQIMGGSLTAILGFAPIFTSRRDKIIALLAMLHGFEALQQKETKQEDLVKLDQYFDKYFGNLL